MKKRFLFVVFALLFVAVFPRQARAAHLSTSEPVVSRHLIVWGDTLSQIALTECGGVRFVASIARANKIANPDLIYAGATIIIPCKIRRRAEKAPAKKRHMTRLATYVAPAIPLPSMVPAAAQARITIPQAPSISFAEDDAVIASLETLAIPAFISPPIVRSGRKKKLKHYEVSFVATPDDLIFPGVFRGILYTKNGDVLRIGTLRTGLGKLLFWRSSGKVAVSVTKLIDGTYLFDFVLKKKPPKGYMLAIDFDGQGVEMIPNKVMQAGTYSGKPVVKTESDKAYKPFLASLGLKEHHLLGRLRSVGMFGVRVGVAFATGGPVGGGISLGTSIASDITHRHLKAARQKLEVLQTGGH